MWKKQIPRIHKSKTCLSDGKQEAIYYYSKQTDHTVYVSLCRSIIATVTP